ncbi:MAG: hypothetical protein DCC55_00405 [Chloroflexi bacterium]|nr:MAG: hypothetical protein DCC55_00405 [Chloroflexota bacterium]
MQLILAEPGCPICRLGDELVYKYLAGLLYESVNDPGIRSALVQSLGFCHRHSRKLLTLPGERAGVAIVQRAVLQEALRRLPTLAAAVPPTLLQRLQDRLAINNEVPGQEGSATTFQEACPACVQQAQVERRALQTLVEHLVDDLAEPLCLAGGLCLPHLEQALRVSPQLATRTLLLQLHQTLWEQLTGHLSEFIRKQDHRFRNEKISDEERAAVERSIAVMTGE